jgi:hypothetical protein
MLVYMGGRVVDIFDPPKDKPKEDAQFMNRGFDNTSQMFDWGAPYDCCDVQRFDSESPMQYCQVPVLEAREKSMTTYPARTLTTEQEELVAEAIGKSIRHANRISLREHIKAGRIERVNHFLTCLRRELTYLESGRWGEGNKHKTLPADVLQWVVSLLCDTAKWHDIGITTLSGHAMISGWLAIAQRKSHSADAQSEIILGDLEELERGLVCVKQTVHDAERINKEGELVSAKLCEVFS